MFGATVRACASPREVIEFGGFHVDAESGEILDVAESDSEPITIELVGNRVLASLWEYIGIALPSEFALDSRAQETHYATKAFGGIKDVDPCWVANGDKNEAAGGPATTKRLREQHARWAGQQAAALAESAPFDEEEQKRAGLSRRVAVIGPVPDGDFHCHAKDFPQVGADGRLRATKDHGAGATYSSAGASSKSKFIQGRDKHILVASGRFPDGDPYPPLPRAYVVTLGGSSRAAAGIQTLHRASRFGVPEPNRRVSMDRIYTGVDAAEFEHIVDELGWTITKSLTKAQKSVKPWSPGVILLDGFWFSDAIPKKYRNLPERPTGVSSETLRALEARYDKRRPYAFRLRGKSAAGSTRLIGPAVPRKIIKNKAGQPIKAMGILVRCPNSPYRNLAPAHAPRTTCLKGHKCGCSETITVSKAEKPNSYEPTLWGTSNWSAKYNRRNLVESYNAKETYHNFISKHAIRVAAERWDLANLMLTLAVFHSAVHNWLMRQGAHALDRDDYRRGFLVRSVIDAILDRVMLRETVPPAQSDRREPPPD